MMNELSTATTEADAEDKWSPLVFANLLLRWRRTIVLTGLAAAIIGLATGLLQRRMYLSGATFIPQSTEASGGGLGLALAASSFGIRVPTPGATWGAPLYVEVLTSRSLLDTIAKDTVAVTEQGGRRVALMDLFEIRGGNGPERLERAVTALQDIIRATEVKTMGAVKLTVRTRWPSVSYALATRLLQGVNKFNIETRKSQALAERQFVEGQVASAERSLRAAEERLESFLQDNRIIGSPDLQLARDRLQRRVSLLQGVYGSLLQSQEEARIREVRDTPVITVLEAPQVPVSGEARKSVQKAVMFGVAGGFAAVVLILIAHAVSVTRTSPTGPAREFFDLIDAATPRIFRRTRP